jgi:hypothetical protein
MPSEIRRDDGVARGLSDDREAPSFRWGLGFPADPVEDTPPLHPAI